MNRHVQLIPVAIAGLGISVMLVSGCSNSNSTGLSATSGPDSTSSAFLGEDSGCQRPSMDALKHIAATFNDQTRYRRADIIGATAYSNDKGNTSVVLGTMAKSTTGESLSGPGSAWLVRADKVKSLTSEAAAAQTPPGGTYEEPKLSDSEKSLLNNARLCSQYRDRYGVDWHAPTTDNSCTGGTPAPDYDLSNLSLHSGLSLTSIYINTDSQPGSTADYLGANVSENGTIKVWGAVWQSSLGYLAPANEEAERVSDSIYNVTKQLNSTDRSRISAVQKCVSADG